MSIEGHRRIYRAMLVVFPKGFRTRFGDEMERSFVDQLHHSGSLSRLWISTFGDLARSLSCEQMEENMRKGYLVGLLGAMLAVAGSIGLIQGRRDTAAGISPALFGGGLIIVAMVWVAVVFARSADRPGSLAIEGGSGAPASAVRHLKWLAIPIAVPGLVFGFFGLAWMAPTPGAVGVGLLALSAVVWKVFGGRL